MFEIKQQITNEIDKDGEGRREANWKALRSPVLNRIANAGRMRGSCHGAGLFPV